jgi:hypothetical protein
VVLRLNLAAISLLGPRLRQLPRRLSLLQPGLVQDPGRRPPRDHRHSIERHVLGLADERGWLPDLAGEDPGAGRVQREGPTDSRHHYYLLGERASVRGYLGGSGGFAQEARGDRTAEEAEAGSARADCLRQLPARSHWRSRRRDAEGVVRGLLPRWASIALLALLGLLAIAISGLCVLHVGQTRPKKDVAGRYAVTREDTQTRPLEQLQATRPPEQIQSRGPPQPGH